MIWIRAALRRLAERRTATAAIHSDEAARAVVVARLQEVRPGACLYLRAYEWRDCPELRPGQYVDVRVTQLGEHMVIDGQKQWIGVIGHHLECAWVDGDTHAPCLVMLARVDAVLRSVTS